MLSTGALLSCGNTFGICLKRKKTHCLCICFSLFRWYWNVLAHWACFPNTMGFGLFLSEVEGGCFVMWLWAPDAYAVITRISMVKTDHDLQLQPRNVFCDMIEKLVYWGPDYMANFSPASETNPFKIKLSITWRGIQPGLKILARFSQTGLGFSARPNGPENLKKSSPGWKSRKQYGCR